MRILILVLLLQGCAIIQYDGLSDGTTHVSGYVLGNTTALENGEFSIGADRSRSLRLNKFNSNQTDAFDKINQGISLIIEGAVKGAK